MIFLQVINDQAFCSENPKRLWDDQIETEVQNEMLQKFNCSPPFWSKASFNSSSVDDDCKFNNWSQDQLAEFQDTFPGF